MKNRKAGVVIPAVGKLKQKDLQFKVSQGY
jgi:hypothetical protein